MLRPVSPFLEDLPETGHQARSPLHPCGPQAGRKWILYCRNWIRSPDLQRHEKRVDSLFHSRCWVNLNKKKKKEKKLGPGTSLVVQWLTLSSQAPSAGGPGLIPGTPLQYSCLENPMDGGAWWATVHGVAKSRTLLSDFPFTFHFHALEKEMATHSSVLAWRIPGTGEPGGLPSMGSHRVGHD